MDLPKREFEPIHYGIINSFPNSASCSVSLFSLSEINSNDLASSHFDVMLQPYNGTLFFENDLQASDLRKCYNIRYTIYKLTYKL